MTNTISKALGSIKDMIKRGDIKDLIEKAKPVMPSEKPLSEIVPHELNWCNKATIERQSFIKNATGVSFDSLGTVHNIDNHEILRGNIENFIGMSQVPTGIIGPLRINGLEAHGDFYIPMATSEGALV